MNTITQSLKVILLAVILSFGVSYVFAWVSPTSAPTGGNSSAPLNTSNNDQVKNGNLFLNALGITNTGFGALNVAGGAVFGGDVEIANGKGITLGGVKKTAWPNGSATDWNTITNKPAGFADGVDNVDGSIIPGSTIYQCPNPGCSTCRGQLTTSSTCISNQGAGCAGPSVTLSCTAIGRLII